MIQHINMNASFDFEPRKSIWCSSLNSTNKSLKLRKWDLFCIMSFFALPYHNAHNTYDQSGYSLLLLIEFAG